MDHDIIAIQQGNEKINIPAEVENKIIDILANTQIINSNASHKIIAKYISNQCAEYRHNTVSCFAFFYVLMSNVSQVADIKNYGNLLRELYIALGVHIDEDESLIILGIDDTNAYIFDFLSKQLPTAISMQYIKMDLSEESINPSTLLKKMIKELDENKNTYLDMIEENYDILNTIKKNTVPIDEFKENYEDNFEQQMMEMSKSFKTADISRFNALLSQVESYLQNNQNIASADIEKLGENTSKIRKAIKNIETLEEANASKIKEVQEMMLVISKSISDINSNIENAEDVKQETGEDAYRLDFENVEKQLQTIKNMMEELSVKGNDETHNKTKEQDFESLLAPLLGKMDIIQDSIGSINEKLQEYNLSQKELADTISNRVLGMILPKVKEQIGEIRIPSGENYEISEISGILSELQALKNTQKDTFELLQGEIEESRKIRQKLSDGKIVEESRREENEKGGASQAQAHSSANTQKDSFLSFFAGFGKKNKKQNKHNKQNKQSENESDEYIDDVEGEENVGY